MKFPYTMFVIVTPEGGHCPFLMRPTRTKSIDAFNAWYIDMRWVSAYRKGWRCVKMNCAPARKTP